MTSAPLTQDQRLEISRIMKNEISRVHKAFDHGSQTAPPSYSVPANVQTQRDDQNQRLVHLTQMASEEQKKDIVKFLVFGFFIILVICVCIVLLFTTDFGKDIQRHLQKLFGIGSINETPNQVEKTTPPLDGAVSVDDIDDDYVYVDDDALSEEGGGGIAV